jgi:pyruvate/2-oxoglutarate/acetoin dehydrogenase E1 component
VLTGMGLGAAGSGFRPIVNWRMVTFSFVAMDQIVNQASKIRYMFGGQADFPVTYRCTTGGGIGLAAQHSQSPYSMWMHLAGLKIILPSTPADAKGLLKSAIRDDNPVVFIEGEVLYADQGEIPDGEYTIPIGVAEVKRQGKDITIIGWSKMVKIALAAADELAGQGIEVEVVDPRTIRPLDEELIVESVKKTGRCLIIEEGWPFNGVGAEIAYRVGRRCFDDLDAPVERITGADLPMPYNHHLEQQCIPDVPRAVAAVKKLLYLE